jgi:uncharacterized cupredoxin-like copper-binding protein
MSRKVRRMNRVFAFPIFSIALLLGALGLTAGAVQTPDVIRIGTLPGLRFDTSVFSVRPGAEVELVFSNYDEMLHNLVITRPDARQRVVQAALELGAGAADRDFVPSSPDVLWSTKVVPTDQSVTLKFRAPTTLGDYPFVCTLPGHGLVMFGTMTVTATPGPPVMTPAELPGSDTSHPHAASTPGATVMRGFMPDAGPASITVQLPGNVSYVWDAGAGRFRYAWLGGGAILPSSPERGLARINGEIFYRESAFPLRIGTTPAAPPRVVEFRGYTLDAARIPEFETLVDGATVRERLEVVAGRLIRRFRISGATTVWFSVPEGAEGVEVIGGTREDAFYRIPAPAQEFTVALTIPVPAAAPAVTP